MSRTYDVATDVFRSFYRLWLHRPPVFPVEAYFPTASILERNWREIRREVLALPGGPKRFPRLSDLLESQVTLDDGDSVAWRYFTLRAFGHDQVANQRLCPVTSRLIRSLPNVIGAGFSVLEPKKHIPSHVGPYAGMLRYHLGLVVPQGANGDPSSALRVENRIYQWREGEGILFDDSRDHEAWNNADFPRIILIVDILRPDMPFMLRAVDHVMRGIISRSPLARNFIDRSEMDFGSELSSG